MDKRFQEAQMELLVKRLKDGAIVPTRGSDAAMGHDVYACLDNDITLDPGKRGVIPIGWAMTLGGAPEWIETCHGPLRVRYSIDARPRSGLAAKNGLTVLNAPGTIDMDFRGEVGIILINLGDEPVTIKHGDRIAQVVPTMGPDTRETIVVKELEDTERGAGGFGSTGVGLDTDGK